MLVNTTVRTAKALLFHYLLPLLFHISMQVQSAPVTWVLRLYKSSTIYFKSSSTCVNVLDSCVLKQNGFNHKLFLFRIVPLPKGKDPQHNMFHVLRPSGKYGFSDTRMSCGGGSTTRKFHLVIISSFLCL